MNTDTSDEAKAAFFADIQEMVGSTGTPRVARDPVNEPTIRTWCDAMSESNSLFTDPDAAAAGPHRGIVAPPAMLNVWTMPGLIMGQQPARDPNEPSAAVYTKLDEAGFSSVVATNSEHEYHRYLRPGDVLTGLTTLVEASEEKHTVLGTGHFVTTQVAYTDQFGELVGSMLFRVFKFRPGTGRAKPTDPKRQALIDVGLDPDEVMPEKPRPKRPLPQWNQDQAWHWEGLRQGELRIQRFTDDGTLVHPPANANPNTHAMDYDWIVASGRATLYSYTVPHHPQVPAFDYPLIVGLVELEEGVRLVTNIVACTPEQLEIGMPLEACYVDTHDDVTLHQFRPATPSPRTTTLTLADIAVDDRLPLCPIPLDPRLIVSTALATRDYQDVHHDRDAAITKGSNDIFMNILTSSGVATRWIGDWAGPRVMFKNLRIRLGAPNYPYDTMTMSGSIVSIDDGVVTVGFRGRNSLGDHITGTADIVLPAAE